MIQISSSAAREIKRMLSLQLQPNLFFRLKVSSGGCSGLFYEMEFDETVRSSDRLYDCAGISVVIDDRSENYISRLTLDYSEDLMGGGFRFNNPNAEQVCGCGNSFKQI